MRVRRPLWILPAIAAAVALLVLVLLRRGQDAPPRTHPPALAGTYAASGASFQEEVRGAMRYEWTERIRRADDEAARAIEQRIDQAAEAWSEALANELVLSPDGGVSWRLLEARTSGMQPVELVDLPPPSVPAVYGGTWWQEEPGTLKVRFESRNGRPLRYPRTSTLRLRDDGALIVPWARDLDISIDEQPLERRAGATPRAE